MRSPAKSRLSYRAAICIFAVISVVVVATGMLPAKASVVVAPEKAVSVKPESASRLTLKDWLLIAK